MKIGQAFGRFGAAMLTALLLLAGVPAAKAAATFWTNTSLGDWFIDTNWDSGVPNANTTAIINNGATVFLNAPGAIADDVFVGDAEAGSVGNGTLLMSTGTSGVPGSLTANSVSCGLSFTNQTQVVSGTINISNGASVTATGLRIERPYGVAIGDGTSNGHRAGGSVDVNGAGSLLNSKVGSIGIGMADSTGGTLVIENGARAQSVGGTIHIGSVTVKGAGSVWDSSKSLSVGSDNPNCSLLITNGGLVKATSLQLSNGIVIVNNGSTTVPGLTISGPGTALAFLSLGVLVIGDTTAGRMEVRNGAGVGTYRGFMGNNSGGVGAVLITDAKSKWSASGSIWVGNAGSGTLDVLNGAVVSSSGNGYLAFTNNTTGVATVDGVNSAWMMTANLYIGGNGAAAGGVGQLVIRNGGTVSAAAITLWGSGILTLGTNSTLTGPLTAMGGVMETTAPITLPNNFTLGTGGLFVRTYGFNSTLSGTITGSGGLNKAGTFTGSGLGTLTLTGNSNYTGPTTVSFGKLVVDGSITSAVTVNSSAILGGIGGVGGITINSGGTLAPGHSPGILTVNGNYVQKSGGVLNVEIGGPTPGSGFDQVAVSGSATVDGTLNLSLVNGYRPVVGQQFAILTSSSETGNFATINSSGFTARSDASNTGIVLTVTSVVPGAPVITSATGASGTQGQPFNYQITATDSPTSFGATPLPGGLSINTTTGIISGIPSAIGSFDVVISAANATGTGSATLTLTISAPPPPITTLANVSTRMRVETGDNALIGGFIITGTQPKKVIVTALGPSLSQFFSGVLANPVLELYSGNTLLESNDNWVDSPNKQAIIDSTLAPSNNVESAIIRTLPANSSQYTAIVRGLDNGTGVGVVQVFDLDRSVDSKLANISTRGIVQTGDNVMIGGFIILGANQQKVIVIALGPSLPVPGSLADPTLELRDGNGVLIDSNDNWVDSPDKQAIIDSTVAPSNNLESAIIATLPSNGAQYTAIVRGVNGTIGVAVVEVFALN
jgi:T5SS/PEP-CTERM-associated repeat protein/autotransporter-associated beta strand protein